MPLQFCIIFVILQTVIVDKMKKRLSLVLTFLFFLLNGCFAAYLENVPQTLLQPNGDTLHCFASGDEFFNWLHDADGFTIMRNPTTGYYVYADKVGRTLVPTDYVAGRVNPSEVGLSPYLVIDSEQWLERRSQRDALTPPRTIIRDGNANRGEIQNIVVFIRFADDSEFTLPFSDVDSMFNGPSATDISLYHYFQSASYHQLTIHSTFYPTQHGNTVISYQDVYPRRFFMPISSTNPDGYDPNVSGAQADREHALLSRAIHAIEDQIPDSLNLDYDNNGEVDNVVFVIQGNPTGWNDLLWPHMWSLYTQQNACYIHGKRVMGYNLQMSGPSYMIEVSTLCHEMNHTLGAPDLYHYNTNTGWKPVGTWDLMHQDGPIPQNMGAYMKYKYGNWIDSIPELTHCGTYSLYSLANSSVHNCYKVPTSDPRVFYVLEYRNKSDFFDRPIPGTGLLIYRINTRYNGNANYNGTTTFDEVYIFRPNGTVSQDGTVANAAFSANTGRTEFHTGTNPQPFFTDGTIDSLFYIHQVSLAGGDSILFTYCPQNYLYVSNNEVNLNSLSGSSNQFDVSSDIGWEIVSDCDWLSVTPTSGQGDATISVTALGENDELDSRECVLTITTELGYSRTVRVVQRGLSPYILVNQSSQSLENSLEDTMALFVSSNTEWNITSNSGWLTLSQWSGEGDDTVYVVANELNTSCATRIAALTFTGEGNAQTTVGVRQAGSEPIFEITLPLAEMMPLSGAVYGFSVQANSSWSISCLSNWLDFNPSSANGSASVAAVARNANLTGAPRTAQVTVTDACGSSETFGIVQSQGYLRLSEDVISLGGGSGNQAALTLQCNGTWRVNSASLPEWIDVSPSSAQYAYETPVTITTIGSNEGEAPRSADIDFVAGSMHATLTVLQSTVGVNEQTLSGVRIYPTLVGEMLTVETPIDSRHSFCLTDMCGRRLVCGTCEGGTQQISCESLSSGVYLLVLSDDQNVRHVFKIVKK